MAQPTTVAHNAFLIKVGDGGSPETFSKIALAMVSRGFNTSIQTTDITVPDMADEDALVDVKKNPSTRSRSMTGKGIIDTVGWQAIEASSGVKKNYQISMTGVGTWVGPCILTANNVSSDRANVVNADITIDAADTLVFTPAGGLTAEEALKSAGKINKDGNTANIKIADAPKA